METRNPEGYRNLLAYQKAAELQAYTNLFVVNLPKTKTFFDLADQMGRSGRSGSKNIVEGWKRNTTKEYFDFLGFSIGAVEELKDDAADITTGVYPQLMGLKGSMGVMGDPLSPLIPFNPVTRPELDKLKFYPLDPTLPAVIQLFLRAKELNFLLYKLQKSLDVKMDHDHTKPISERVRKNWEADKQADVEIEKYFKDSGFIRLENGQLVTKEELAKMEKEKRDKGEKGGIPLFPSR